MYLNRQKFQEQIDKRRDKLRKFVASQFSSLPHEPKITIGFNGFPKIEKFHSTGLSMAGIKLILHLESKRNKQFIYKIIECPVTESRLFGEVRITVDYQPFHKHVESLRKIIIAGEEKERQYVVLVIGMHYLGLVFEFKKDKKECVILDAIADPRSIPVYHYLKRVDFFNAVYFFRDKKNKVKKNNLQKDWFSCSIFTVDHLIEVSKIDNIFEYLSAVYSLNNFDKQEKVGRRIGWEYAPPSLVRNVQSIQWLESYVRSFPEILQKIPKIFADRDNDLNELTSILNNEKQAWISKVSRGIEFFSFTKINPSVKIRFNDFKEAVMKYIEIADVFELQELIWLDINETEEVASKKEVLLPNFLAKNTDNLDFSPDYNIQYTIYNSNQAYNGKLIEDKLEDSSDKESKFLNEKVKMVNVTPGVSADLLEEKNTEDDYEEPQQEYSEHRSLDY